MTGLDLATCSYAEFQPDMGTPVRTSNGAPRWALPYMLEHVCRDLMPPRRLLGAQVPAQEFSTAYAAHLDALGMDAITAELARIAGLAGPGPLVLLCFERLDIGKACHRTDFAAWWTARTGELVSELGAPPADLLPL